MRQRWGAQLQVMHDEPRGMETLNTTKQLQQAVRSAAERVEIKHGHGAG